MTTVAPATMSTVRAASVLPLRRTDILFGMIAPLVCFLADFFLLRVSLLAPVGLLLFAAQGIVGLLVSGRIGLQDGARGALAGALAAGGIGAIVIGLALLPLSVLGLLAAGTGLLGFLPFATAWVFLRRAVAMMRGEGRRHWQPFVLGALAMIGVPAALQGADSEWVGSRFVMIESLDAAEVMKALRGIAAYPFTFGRADRLVCRVIVLRPHPDATVRQAGENLIGADAKSRCSKL